MSYTIIWQPTALNTYIEEVDFIFFKWNFEEVEKFHILVKANLERLAINPTIGIYKKEFKLNMLVVSKQTTLFYTINSNTKIIELNFFWNNSRNPDDLTKLLY